MNRETYLKRRLYELGMKKTQDQMGSDLSIRRDICHVCKEKYKMSVLGYEGGVYCQDVLSHERRHKNE